MGSGDSPGLQNRRTASLMSSVCSTHTRFRQFVFQQVRLFWCGLRAAPPFDSAQGGSFLVFKGWEARIEASPPPEVFREKPRKPFTQHSPPIVTRCIMPYASASALLLRSYRYYAYGEAGRVLVNGQKKAELKVRVPK